MRHAMSRHMALVATLGMLLPYASRAQNTSPRDGIAPRTAPKLVDEAAGVEHDAWLSGAFAAEGGDIVWVKAIWGRNNEYCYKNWEQREPWGNAPVWYITHPRVMWFNGKMFAIFTERNRPHGWGDTVIHIMVSNQACQRWTTVAHFEVEEGLTSTHLTVASDDRLMLAGLRKANSTMMASFSRDGLEWSPLREFDTVGEDAGPIGQIFQLTWHDGKAYGLSRPGVPWMSDDGLNYQHITVTEPADGDVGGNETASTFLGDRWIVFQRSGIIASSDPPYTHWKLNKRNYKGEHSYGGPDILTLPDGQVIAGSRASGYPDLGGSFGGHMAVLFRYDGERLTPLVGFESGATMTGYPGLTWHDGYLYVSFLRDRPASGAWQSARGEFALAKIKWPLKEVNSSKRR